MQENDRLFLLSGLSRTVDPNPHGGGDHQGQRGSREARGGPPRPGDEARILVLVNT